jgi:hypothetical protein
VVKRNGLTRRQVRALEFMAHAAETDGELLIAADDLPWSGNKSNTLKGLAQRGLAIVADASARPYLWRVTLAGLVRARELRGTLPDLIGIPRW